MPVNYERAHRTGLEQPERRNHLCARVVDGVGSHHSHMPFVVTGGSGQTTDSDSPCMDGGQAGNGRSLKTGAGL